VCVKLYGYFNLVAVLEYLYDIYVFCSSLYQFLIDSKSLGAYTRKHRWSEPAIGLKFALVDGVHIAKSV